jgi:hypothetical protein
MVGPSNMAAIGFTYAQQMRYSMQPYFRSVAATRRHILKKLGERTLGTKLTT